MHNPSFVAVYNALQELVQNGLHQWFIQRFSLFVQVFLHILVEVLENEEETVFIFTVDNLVEVDDMRVLLQLL